MGKVCEPCHRRGLSAEYGSCDPIHAPDSLSPEAAAYSRENARARKAILALEEYQRNMSAALRASMKGDHATAHWFAGSARAALNLYPEIRAHVDA